jgi:hypothetical protein
MTDLTPDAALCELAELKARHLKRGQKKIDDAIDDAGDIQRVYDLCAAANIGVQKWLRDNWDVKPRYAELALVLYRNRDLLRGTEIKPTVAMKLFAPHVNPDVALTVLDLVKQGVKVTSAMVDKIIRDDVFTESIGMVASYLLDRDGKPKDILNELAALKAEIDARRATGLAFDETFTEAVMHRAIAQREAEYALNLTVAARLHICDGRAVTFDVRDVPVELLDPAWQDTTFQLVVRRKAA